MFFGQPVFILEENFFSIYRKITAIIIFGRVMAKKPSKIVKFTKIRQTLRNTHLRDQRGAV